MTAIYKKEMRTYFSQMTGYIFLTLMTALTAIFYIIMNVFQSSPNYFQVLSNSTILYFVMIPTLTMRLFSEEVRNKTDQLLFTCPLTVTQIVIGKYLAAASLFLSAMGVTVLFPVISAQFGELPISQIIGAFIGYILMGLCFISVGLFISVLTDNQIIAAVGTFGVLFIFFVMDAISANMPTDTTASLVFVGILIVSVAGIWYNSTKNVYAAAALGGIGLLISFVLYFINNLIFDGFIVRFLRWFSVYSRYSNFSNGILNLADISYYITFGVIFIYLAINIIEKRRWR